MSKERNILKETVERDEKLDWEQDFVGKAKENKLYQRVMREYMLSDISGALGRVHDVVIEAAKKMAVGRQIIWTVPVTEPKVRFYKAKRGKVWRISEGPPLSMPERFETVDVDIDHEYGYDALFSQSYLEDLPFPAIERAIKDAGQLMEEKITSDVIALYDGIAETNLASGANVDVASSGTLAWGDLVKGWTALKAEGFNAKVMVAHPNEVEDLWKDDKFIHSFYFGDKVDVERGVLGSTYLGFKIVESDLMVDASDYVYLIDTDVAAVLLMRRDITTQPYENPAKLEQGVLLSMRYGLKELRTKAICRIDVTP